jgi:hypothetical protein
VAVERDAVEAGLFHPVLFFDALTDFLRPLAVLSRRVVQAAQLREVGHGVEGGARIGLYFDERNRAVREAAVGVKDGIMAVFPALIRQTAVRFALIVQQAKAILVAHARDPLRRAL